MAKRDTTFKPGQSGNPRGRPKGSRNKLGEEFICELHAEFHGARQGCDRGTSPREQARGLPQADRADHPKEFHVRDNTLDHMTDDELADFLSEIRAAKERASRALAAELAAQARGEDEPDSVH